MNNWRPKLLFFLKLPPPMTGATYINSLICDSNLIKSSFEIKRIDLSYKESIGGRKVFSVFKVFKIVQYHYSLAKSLFTFRPDIVYFQISPLGWAFLRDVTYVLVIKLSGKHPVYHLHGKGISEVSSKSFILRWLYRFVFNGSSIICVSVKLVNDIKPVYNDIPYIIPNAIPLFDYTKEQEREKDKFRILFLSNIQRSKGFIDFLNAIELFNDEIKLEFEAVIVGSPVDFTTNQIEAEIVKRGLNNVVRYIGPVYGIEKQKLLFYSDVLVFPTLNDIWGLVILEAMQAGIPIIATDEGAIPEILEEGVSGFIVNKQSPEQIREKLQFLCQNPELGWKMGNAGRKKYFEKYTFETFELNLKNVFEEIIKKRNDIPK